MFVCGGTDYPVEMPAVGDGECCEGALFDAPQACTCWKPVYDLEQRAPVPGEAGLPAGMCADCAFRPKSPERQGAPGYNGDAAALDELVTSGSPFWCHQGIRKPVKWVHPSGAEVAGHPADYQPPIVAGVPFKADGTRADLCAGWAVRRLRHLQREAS
jgi:hypothetical protein